MDKDFQIHASSNPYDMTWYTEKTSCVVQELANIIETLDNASELKEETRNKILISLYPAIYDATKMMAFSCNAKWEPTDREIILKGGKFAFEELQIKYGLIQESSEDKRIFSIKELIISMRKHLSKSKSPDRTLLHDLFERSRVKNKILDAIAENLNKVSMGEGEWEPFVRYATAMLDSLEKDIEKK